MPEFFDAHCHVCSDFRGVLSGGTGMPAALAGRLLCGVSPGDWDAVDAAAAAEGNVVPAFGLHPWEAADVCDGWLDILERKLRSRPDAWLGEAGLDRARTDRVSLDRQRECLVAQLGLARRLRRPASLHCVRAWGDMLPLLDREYVTGGDDRFVMHAFAGPPAAVGAFAGRGAYFSVGSSVLKRGFRRQRECVAAIPDERLLVESDVRVCAPDDGSGDLAAVIACLAALRGRSPADVVRLVLDNSRRLFRGR